MMIDNSELKIHYKDASCLRLLGMIQHLSIPLTTSNLHQGIEYLKGFQESFHILSLCGRKRCSPTSLEDFKVLVELRRQLSVRKLAPTNCRTFPELWNSPAIFLPVAGGRMVGDGGPYYLECVYKGL